MAGVRKKSIHWIKEYLEEKVDAYNRKSFIENDPVSIPHRFTSKEDIEISAFLTSTIAWGNRKAIIKGAISMMELLENDPHRFITEHTSADLKKIKPYVYRTFNHVDFLAFISALKYIYNKKGGLERCFASETDSFESISNFRKLFNQQFSAARTHKHVSNPDKNASCKRLNMYLRWMVRSDNRGVDFGIWKCIKPSQLMVPLDVHTGNTARKLGLLKRNANDRKSVEEIMAILRDFDPVDPVKYDFALFGAGVDKTNGLFVTVE